MVDSRTMTTGDAIRRRRECLHCNKRFTTYEQIESMPIMVIKRDERREPFNRSKVISGLRKAFQKRPVSEQQIEELANEIEMRLHNEEDREVPSTAIGEAIMEILRKTDQVAYVRFASVYRDFKDVSQFMEELKTLLEDGKVPVYRNISAQAGKPGEPAEAEEPQKVEI